MTDNVENLVLEHLRIIRNDIRDFREESRQEFQLIKLRLSSLETQISNMHVDLAAI